VTHFALNACCTDISVERELINAVRELTHVVFYTCAS